MKKIIFLIALHTPIFVFALTDKNTAFDKAKIAYDANKFEQALHLYQSIEKQQLESFELYYNVANCYYKLNQTARAIQYYLKSLKLDPSNADAKNNLKFAFLKTRDKIEPKEELFLNRWWKSIYNSNSSNTWAWFVVVELVVLCSLLAAFFIAKTELKRKTLFFSSLLFLILALTNYFFAYKQYKFATIQNEAVILNESVSIKSAPTNNATNLFVLHEGTVVNIIEENQNWFRIQLDNQKEGWVTIEDIVLI